MKRTVNLTTSSGDMDRLRSRENLLPLLEGLDGFELMVFEEDANGFVTPDLVTGLHTSLFPCWLDLWRYNEAALLDEFGTLEVAEQYYGGLSPSLLVDKLAGELEHARRYGAEYVVFHVAHAGIAEMLTGRYLHSDEEVVDAAADWLNEVFDNLKPNLLLLVENLWSPGLTFTRPEITQRLMDRIHHPDKGIILDTGHLMHTNHSLRSEEEAVAYIHKMLDEHGELARHVRAIHLNKSLTGEYQRQALASPPVLAQDYSERYGQLFTHIFKTDLHQPFTHPAVKPLVERIAPDYLTFEFITADNAQLLQYLREQRAVF